MSKKFMEAALGLALTSGCMTVKPFESGEHPHDADSVVIDYRLKTEEVFELWDTRGKETDAEGNTDDNDRYHMNVLERDLVPTFQICPIEGHAPISVTTVELGNKRKTPREVLDCLHAKGLRPLIMKEAFQLDMDNFGFLYANGRVVLMGDTLDKFLTDHTAFGVLDPTAYGYTFKTVPWEQMWDANIPVHVLVTANQGCVR